MSTPRPNVLVVLADQLRASSVGYAGEEPVLTPHMDLLAAQSAQCTVGVSLMPVCTPYRGALLTGRTPLSLGLVLNDIPLSTHEVSLGHAFGAAGYRTGYIGKWHLNGPDRPAWVPPGPAQARARRSRGSGLKGWAAGRSSGVPCWWARQATSR